MKKKPVAKARTIEKTDRSRQIRAVYWFVLLISAGLILAAARGDLWLDEIWSLSMALDSNSITDVFTRFHHDNNHPLNTLFLYFMGEQQILYLYRLCAVLSGIGSVFLVGFIAKEQWGYPEAVCSIVLTGLSYPLMLYFSEARGYAPAILFALASYEILRRNMLRFTPARVVLFWTASVLGMLSHSTFIMATIAFTFWNILHEFNADGPFSQKTGRFVAYNVPPLLFFGWWYAFFLKDMVIGGGPVYGTWTVLGQASALMLGFPDVYGLFSAAVVCVLILSALGAISLRQERDSQWIFFSTVLGLSPALLLIVTEPKFLYFRYFILCFPFFYLLLSYMACKYYRSWPSRWRWLVLAAIALLIAGQIPRVSVLLKFGRGNYSSALAHIMESSPNGIVRVGSDHDFRNRSLVEFYASRVAGGDNLRYVMQPRWTEEPPDWIIMHSQDVAVRPREAFDREGTGAYRLEDEYRFSGISGWNWFLFRRKM